jgi:hypothetical protein
MPQDLSATSLQDSFILMMLIIQASGPSFNARNIGPSTSLRFSDPVQRNLSRSVNWARCRYLDVVNPFYAVEALFALGHQSAWATMLLWQRLAIQPRGQQHVREHRFIQGQPDGEVGGADGHVPSFGKQ